MSELSVLLQARREIKEDIAKEQALPKWDRKNIKKLDDALKETNERICQMIENKTEGDLTLC